MDAVNAGGKGVRSAYSRRARKLAAIMTGREPRHLDPSPICRPAKGSRWEFFVEYMALLKRVPLPPEWMTANSPDIPTELSVWDTTFRHRAQEEKERLEGVLREAGVPEASLVEPYPEGVQNLVVLLRSGCALALMGYGNTLPTTRPRRQKITHDRTMLIGMSCVFNRKDGMTPNAVHVATAAYLNEGLPRDSKNAGLTRDMVAREFVKFRRICKGPYGPSQSYEAFAFYNRLVEIEERARLNPNLQHLKGAALVRAIEKRGDAVSGFLKRIILPNFYPRVF